MNESQVKWASKHDWYVGQGTTSDGQVFVSVNDCYTIGGVLENGGVTDFTDYQELKEWAGY